VELRTSERYYAMDAMRACMMMLGVILHSAISYSGVLSESFHWTFKDTHTNMAFDLMIVSVHLFRMPAFFLTAGFFAAYSYTKRKGADFAFNRTKRVLLPFVFGLLLLGPLNKSLFEFCSLYTGNNFSEAIAASFTMRIFSLYFNDIILMHLWFLYYLILYYLLALLMAKIHLNISGIFQKIVSRRFGLFLIAVPGSVLIYFMTSGTYDTPVYLWPMEWTTFLAYGLFFLFGWLLFKNQDLIRTLLENTKICAVSIMLLVLPYFFLIKSYDSFCNDVFSLQKACLAFITSLMSWLLVISSLSFFYTVLNKYNDRIRVLADASYFVYLIHIPVIVFAAGLLKPYDLSAITKFILVLISSLIFLYFLYKIYRIAIPRRF
jgi:glucan biosynthesis protein C